MLDIVGLAEDIVSSVLNPCGSIVPVRALVARLVVYMHPDLWRRRDQYPRRDTGDRTWLESRLSAAAMEMTSWYKMPSTRSALQTTRTMFLVHISVPLVAATTEHRYAMGPVRDTGPRGAAELAQFGIRADRPENIEDQKATESQYRWARHAVYPHGALSMSRGVGVDE